jgi:tripartite-type tricarboxylate transporter receptor subunit TctC
MFGNRRWIAVILFSLIECTAGAAQDYPNRLVKFIVPSLAGSTTDFMARLIGDQLSQKWGKPVVVENIAGGATNIGADAVFRAAPDGYTLMVTPPAPVTYQHLLFPNLPYEPAKFVPITMLVKIPTALDVRNDFPAKTVAEFIAYAKANPGKITYASQGAGTTAHLTAIQFEMMVGVKMVHVPYRGLQPALNDVVAGHVDALFDLLSTSIPLYRAGKFRMLGVANSERSSAVPEVPTIGEAGVPGFRSTAWFAVVGPPALPAVLVDKINRDVREIMQRPDIDEKLKVLRLESVTGSPAHAAKFFAEETELWGEVIKEGRVTPQ